MNKSIFRAFLGYQTRKKVTFLEADFDKKLTLFYCKIYHTFWPGIKYKI